MIEPAARGDVTSGDHYYILAPSRAADRPKLVLKHQDAFLVADQRGDFPPVQNSEFGLYVAGTRYLRMLELRLYDDPPFLLNTTVSSDNVQIAVDLANPDLWLGDGVVLMGRTLRLERRIALDEDRMYQLVTIESFARRDHELDLSWWFAADFADVFEVRGVARDRRGTALPPVHEGPVARLGYVGLDGITRTTQLEFSPAPNGMEAGVARYRLTLPAGGRRELAITVSALLGDARPRAPARLADVVAERREQDTVLTRRTARVRTDNELLNAWINRASADLHMLGTQTPDGRIPYAGIPWYVAPFGRDSLITALQTLPFNPELARGTLRFLARWQGTRDDPFTDQEPGKILHEYRRGEMANCREIAFIPYYGSVDSTPLFCILLGEYWRWTGDEALLTELWPALSQAVGWTLRARPLDGPFLSYHCRSERGLVHQGWKDSHDAVMHASGEDARSPIALAEAQAYAWAALRTASELAKRRGVSDAKEWGVQAERIRAAFEREFWMEDEGFYALALDGGAAPCRVVSSNPGHCLWAEVVSQERAERVVHRFLQEDMFSGWGLRTLGARQPGYNPMSYHNGSVWPHDTAMAAAGAHRYGLRDAFVRLSTALFDAVVHYEGLRMPELFCGFERTPGGAPTRYPVACSPQAWAAGTVYQLLGSMLGLVPDAAARRLTLNRPVLPPWIAWIDVRGIRVGPARVDLLMSRDGEGCKLEHVDVEEGLEVVLRQ
jgi:glycogen debranching enzyme